MQKLSQSQLIMKHLRKHGSISTQEGLNYGIMALPRRIKDLKESGKNIVAEKKVNDIQYKRYVRYHLLSEQADA